jgi:branched-chain amino acid transport system substrate-binding protein
MLTLSACGSNGGGGNKTITIATLFAVSGTDAADQKPAEYGVDLAVSQASLPSGYTLKVKNENYEGTSGNGYDATIAATDAHTLVSDATVMGIVGPFNSGAAKLAIPVTNSAGLVMISPTNTNNGLTQQQYAQENGIVWEQLHPAGKPDAYFRTCGTDLVQGKVDATVAANAPISAKTAFVVDDNTVYGVGLGDYFTQAFTANGGKTVGSRTHINPNQISNLSSLASTIIAANPDVVFYGGVTTGGGGALKKDLVAAGYTKPMVGGDGIGDDPSFIQTAGSSALNTYGSVAAPDTSTLTSSAAVAFKNAYGSFVANKPDNTLLPYSVMAYDVANIEIAAIKSVINSGKAVTRANVLAAVAATDYTGLTGHITFNANGDNSGGTVWSIYEVDSTGQWVYKTQVSG